MNLNIQNLSKTYPNGTKAMDGISIEINAGMFGLLGPNGAGKSTLMRTIATLQMPDSGEVFFNGDNIFTDKLALRKKLGYLPQEFGVYPRVTAHQLLNYLAELKGVHNKKQRQALIYHCLEMTNLSDVAHKYVKGYSGGMKQRFGIAQLLLNDPDLIIVDEPTAGLDPEERKRFLNILREIGKDHIVIFSTHIVDDISDLCTDMAIMSKGSILQHCKPSHAVATLKGSIYAKTIEKEGLENISTRYQVLSSNYTSANSLRVRIFTKETPDVTFQLVDPNLEDYYFFTLMQNHV